jgi:uncharacterized protein
MTTVNLTKVERALLLNQYKILEIICPENAERYMNCQSILEHGYKIFYDEVLNVWDELDCQYVLDVADLFRLLKQGYEGLVDKEGIDADALKFRGFDGISEWQFGCFASYLKRIGRWEDPPSDYLSIHNPSAYRYHRMVETLTTIKAKHGPRWNFKLTKEEIQKILRS